MKLWQGLRRQGALKTSTSVAMSVAMVGFIVAAVSSSGFTVHHVAANDGAVWITDNSVGSFGRYIDPIRQLNAALVTPPPGTNSVDVMQDGAVVVGLDQHDFTLYAIDPTAAGVRTPGLSLPSQSSVAFGGGVVAVMDPKGEVWAADVDQGGTSSLGSLDFHAKPLVKDAVAVTVAADGTVLAATATQLTSVPLEAAGLGRPVPGPKIAPGLTRNLTMTAVGDTAVLLDGTRHLLDVPATGERVSLPYGSTLNAQLQQPGPGESTVLVATSQGLFKVPLSGASTAGYVIQPGSGGRPAAPVVMGDCDHAAWGGQTGAYARLCTGSAPVLKAVPGPPLAEPVFRVNNGFILLTDGSDGTAWAVTGDPVQVVSSSQWQPLIDRSHPQKDQNSQQQSDQYLVSSQQPTATCPSPLYARPGRATLLHVLDGDTDPGGGVLAIDSITPSSGAGYSLAATPDGQKVILTLGSAPPPSISFKYTVIDANYHTASATCTVTPSTRETPPHLLASAHTPTLRVDSLGTISYQVLSNWRDDEGDPLAVTSASAPSGTASWTGDGEVTFTAPREPSDTVVQVSYQVTDGLSAPVSGQFPVTVLAAGATQAYAAQAAPDAAEVVVGKPAVVEPLQNDLPGADPNSTGAKLALAGSIVAVPGVTVDTDTATGRLTITAQRAGVYSLNYADAYGSAPVAGSKILVRAAAATGSSTPVTTPASVLLHGQNPASVDVLAGDYDPSGNLLTVVDTSVEPLPHATGTPPIQATIVGGQWIRVAAQGALSPNTQYLVDYDVTDGVSAPVKGQVIVTWARPPTPPLPPIASPIQAVVRVGDSVDVPVLNAVEDPNGDPVYLVPGSATVTPPNAGSVMIDGSDVRYAAPPPQPAASAQPAAPQAVTVTYVAEDSDGKTATGTVDLTVNPLPSANVPDAAPVPPEIDARVSAGNTITIPIASTGVDPDGDSVTLTGVGGNPQLGRILAVTASSIQYQAFPLTAGTDVITYQVSDRFGLSGQATIRVGVTPPGQAQTPIAQPVFATGAPGQSLLVDVLANALYPAGNPPSVFVVAGAGSVDAATAQVRVTAPAAGHTAAVSYGVGYGTSPQSLADVYVTGQKGYVAAPVAVDDFPALPSRTAQLVSVAVLKNDYDPSTGTNTGLRVVRVFDGQNPSGSLTFQIKPYPYSVAYQIANPSGATAIGVVHVPGNGAGPHLAPNVQPVQVNPGSPVTVDINKYIADAHGPVHMQTKAISYAPSNGLTAAVVDGTHIQLTAQQAYDGPASVTMTVTDAQSLSDPLAKTASVSIPVEVGLGVPILRCPTIPLTVTEDGQPDTVDVGTVCDAWVPNPAETVTYSVSWKSQPTGVTATVTSGNLLTVAAGPTATTSGSGQLVLVAADAQGHSTPVPLTIQVTAAPLPTVSPINVASISAGRPSAPIPVASYVHSPLAHKQIGIVGSVVETSGMPARATVSGTDVVITPDPNSHGPVTFQVVVTDVAQAGGSTRQVTGTISAQVLGKPDPLGPVTCVGADKQVTLSWSPVNSNGSPVQYDITGSGGSRSTAGTSAIMSGLVDGTSYSFTVQPSNAVGTGASSNVQCQPVAAPGVPGAITLGANAGLDGNVSLSWGASVANDNTQAPTYVVSVTPGVVANQTTTSTTATFTGLKNDEGPYTFTVTPTNSHGHGQPVSSQAIYSYGKPYPPSNVVATPAQPAAGAATTAVVVSWTPPDCNDDQTCLEYTVTPQGGTPATPKTVTGDSATFTLDNNGNDVTFTVTATNQEKLTSDPATSNSVKAISPPPQLGNYSVRAVPSDPTKLQVDFTVPTAYPPVTAIEYSYTDGRTGAASGQMTWSDPASPEYITGLIPNDPYTVTVSVCNATASCSSPPQQSNSVTTSEYPAPSGTAAPGASTTTHGSATYNWYPSGGDPQSGYGMEVTITSYSPFASQLETGNLTYNAYSCSESVSMTDYLILNDGSGHQVSAVSPPIGTVTNPCLPPPTTAPPPPPSQTVTVSWGGYAPASYCGGDASCTYLDITWSGFSSGSHTITPLFDGGYWGAASATQSGSSGSYNGHYWAGYCGSSHTVTATVDGVGSNTINTNQHGC